MYDVNINRIIYNHKINDAKVINHNGYEANELFHVQMHSQLETQFHHP